MYHPVIAYPDVAEALMVVGEETVEPAVGEDTDTVTPAEATALVNSGRTNSEKARLNFPSWSLMGLRVAVLLTIPTRPYP